MIVYLVKLKIKKGKEWKGNIATKKETMYKIGITENLDRRMKEFAPYDAKVLESMELDEEAGRRLENSIKRHYWKFRYYPLFKFGGHTETLQNKMFLSMGDVLSNYWDSINNDKEKKKYYKAKRARAAMAEKKRRRYN